MSPANLLGSLPHFTALLVRRRRRRGRAGQWPECRQDAAVEGPLSLGGVNTSPVHRHYEVSPRPQAFFRYREGTVGQGEGCADLVRRAPPGHRASCSPNPALASDLCIPGAVHRP